MVDSTASELVVAGRRTRRGVHGVVVVALLTVVQVAWLGVIAFAAYRLL